MAEFKCVYMGAHHISIHDLNDNEFLTGKNLSKKFLQNIVATFSFPLFRFYCKFRTEFISQYFIDNKFLLKLFRVHPSEIVRKTNYYLIYLFR